MSRIPLPLISALSPSPTVSSEPEKTKVHLGKIPA